MRVQKEYGIEKAIQVSYCYKNFLLFGCGYHTGIMEIIKRYRSH